MKTFIAIIGTIFLIPSSVLANTTGSISNNSIFNLPDVEAGSQQPTLKTDLLNSDLARMSFANETIFVGTEQVSNINQNPFAIKFIDDTVEWVVEDYETGGPDGRGRGLVWDGGEDFYGVFTVVGGGSGIESLAADGWLSSYGSGGGVGVTVLARLDANTGLQGSDYAGMGTFVSSILSSGRTNSSRPVGISINGDGNVVLENSAFFSPRGIDTTAMDRIGENSSPFDYVVTFDESLNLAISACANGWSDPNTPGGACNSTEITPEPLTIFGSGLIAGLFPFLKRGKNYRLS